MPDDLQLITRRAPGETANSLGLNTAPEYFGDQSNDIQFNTLNDLATVSGITKLKQDINKILLTVQGTNTNFQLYGTTLQNDIGNKTNFQVIQASVRDQVVGALQVLQYVNKENPNPDERLNLINFLQITQPSVDTVLVTLAVTTDSGKTIPASIPILI